MLVTLPIVCTVNKREKIVSRVQEKPLLYAFSTHYLVIIPFWKHKLYIVKFAVEKDQSHCVNCQEEIHVETNEKLPLANLYSLQGVQPFEKDEV